MIAYAGIAAGLIVAMTAVIGFGSPISASKATATS
jgi:hypothetical protein